MVDIPLEGALVGDLFAISLMWLPAQPLRGSTLPSWAIFGDCYLTNSLLLLCLNFLMELVT